MDSVGAEGLLAGASLLSRPAEEFGNDPSVEAMWAMKAMEHAEVYFNILCSVDPKFLKLTPHDDQIYSLFRDKFPDFKVKNMKENDLKSEDAKKEWRPYCEQFKGVVEDYSFGTLLRLNCEEDYSEDNSILVTRIQFYAIELARNKEGFNDVIRSKFSAKKKS
ncbi:protein PBDC1 [Ischnura elegans]|uniref:protein PBDC1 n=1 Tax=Ischnura elegans TaxID=197161 RepID=UPI001ED866FE|nr:protein PBDC1 [Ischnura elegans]